MSAPNLSASSVSDESAYYWDRMKHEENIFTSRGSFFLVGQSMLFAGIATLYSVKDSPAGLWSEPVFCLLGIILAVIWCFVNRLHHVKTRVPLKVELKKDPRYEKISPAGSEAWFGLGKSYTWMGVIVPICVLMAWVGLLIIWMLLRARLLAAM